MLRFAILIAALAAAPAAQAATVTYGSLSAYDAAFGPSTVAEDFTGNKVNGTIIQSIAGAKSFQNNRLQGVAGGAKGPQFTTLVFSKLVNAFAVKLANLSKTEGVNVLIDGIQVATIAGGATFFGISSKKAFGSITFVDATLPGKNTQFAIDDVRVAAVPLPAAGLGLLGAIAALGAIRRRKA
jgi:hypothetical protein